MASNYEMYLKTDLKEYIGKWIAISDVGVVAVGNNAKEVFKEAQTKYPNKKIMLVKVPEEESLIY